MDICSREMERERSKLRDDEQMEDIFIECKKGSAGTTYLLVAEVDHRIVRDQYCETFCS